MNNESPFFPLAAMRTLTASRWTLLLARTLGRKVIGRDGNCTCTGYEWRGKMYLTSFERLPPNTRNQPDKPRRRMRKLHKALANDRA